MTRHAVAKEVDAAASEARSDGSGLEASRRGAGGRCRRRARHRTAGRRGRPGSDGGERSCEQRAPGGHPTAVGYGLGSPCVPAASAPSSKPGEAQMADPPLNASPKNHPADRRPLVRTRRTPGHDARARCVARGQDHMPRKGPKYERKGWEASKKSSPIQMHLTVRAPSGSKSKLPFLCGMRPAHGAHHRHTRPAGDHRAGGPRHARDGLRLEPSGRSNGRLRGPRPPAVELLGLAFFLRGGVTTADHDRGDGGWRRRWGAQEISEPVSDGKPHASEMAAARDGLVLRSCSRPAAVTRYTPTSSPRLPLLP